jgi:hypothetical protein
MLEIANGPDFSDHKQRNIPVQPFRTSFRATSTFACAL